MFYKTEAVIYDGSLAQVGEALVDLQPFERTQNYDDGFEIDISHRAFCDIEATVAAAGYLKIEAQLYKIMNIKQWDDYMELWLYACERSAV